MLRNILWSLLGTGGPLIAAFIAIPMLIEGLGAARFGILTLAWLVVGYFSLFDLGLGRSLTKLVAEKLGAGKEKDIPGVVWTGMLLMVILGVIGAIIMLGLSPWLVESGLKIPEELYPEALAAFYFLGASIPIVIITIGLRGILEAHQRFDLVNIIRLPLGILNFIGPLAILSFSNSLSDIVLALVSMRVVTGFSYLVICYNLYPELRQVKRLDYEISKRLISFGMWMTVSNITGPILLYLGRFLIITVISAEAVAYFATPYEIVIRLLIIPGILVSVIFPTLTHLFQKNPKDVAALYNKSLKYLYMVMLPIVCFFYFFAEDGLAWWINNEFSQQGYRVAQYLSLGVFINSFGHISQALIQGYGRPDLTAKLHLAELTLYIPYLWLLIEQFGIDGAAIAWVIRVAISSLILLYLARGCLSGLIKIKY